VDVGGTDLPEKLFQDQKAFFIGKGFPEPFGEIVTALLKTNPKDRRDIQGGVEALEALLQMWKK